uniref:Ubiquitin-like domain-containing protein n=1 Tax=Chrysotila carterae TaxID=13221 RepID=A0A7S4ES42_CHRCT|eukprot:6214642-Pleurochrysis_carterae.AAC.4
MAFLDALVSPSRVQRTWDLQRSAPTRLELEHVLIRSLSAPNGNVQVEASASMTVKALKTHLAHLLNVPPRKSMHLLWWGAQMDDNCELGRYNINTGAELHLKLTTRPISDLEGLREITQIRVRCDESMIVIKEISEHATILALKKRLLVQNAFRLDPKAAVQSVRLFYSPVMTPLATFATPMEDERTIGSYGVLEDDIMFCKCNRPVPAESNDPKSATSKKK